MNLATLEKRIERIHQAQVARPVLAPPSAEDEECSRLFERLLRKCSAGMRAQLRVNSEAGTVTALLSTAVTVIDRHLRLGAPLELPDAVAEAAVPLTWECVGCSYAVPPGMRQCPLCGRRCGWQTSMIAKGA